MANRYEGLFENWEIGVAKNVIEKLRKQWTCLEREDFDDLMQESLTHWCFAKDKYDPTAGANRQTFMSRVVQKHLQNIIQSLGRNKRKINQISVSLDQPIDETEKTTGLADILPLVRPNHDAELLKSDIAQTLKKLTPRQQKLCELMLDSEANCSEHMEQMGVSRKLFYQEIKRIREVFQSEGLKNYLR